MDTKQVIVIRRDLGMRRGKEIAQGSHASMAWLVMRMHERAWTLRYRLPGSDRTPYVAYLKPAERAWLQSGHTKIVCQVAGLDALLRVAEAAHDADIECQVVTDAGRTEIASGTVTALAIGPDWSERIDKVTGRLELY